MSFFVKKAQENAGPDFSAAHQQGTPSNLALYEASAAGDLGAMQTAVRQGGNPNYMCRAADGATSLHVAARNRNSRTTLEFLVGVGGFVGAKLLGNYNNPLHEALACGNDEGAKILVEVGDADVAAKNSFGNTPLFITVKLGNLTMSQYLISKGHKIDIQNNRGSTTLHLCASLCKETVVAQVPPAAAVGGENLPPPPNDANNNAAVPPAVEKLGGGGGQNEEDEIFVILAAQLIKNGINLNLQDENGYTALHTAAARLVS